MYLKVMLTLLVILEAAAAASLWRAARPDPGATYYADDEVAAGLNRRVGKVDTGRVTLRAAVEQLAAAAGARVAFAPGVLDPTDEPLYAEVTVQLEGVPLSAALAAVLPWDLVPVPGEDATVRIVPRADAWGDVVVRAYPLDGVLPGTAPPSGPDEAAETVSFLEDFLVEEAGAIGYDGNPAGSFHVTGDVVVAVQTEAIHRRIERVLAELAAAAAEAETR